ncbi:MAG: sigma-70 family RNA polymerase sigma factor [Lachnospiraceae bacterium]|nr:sigma-70 family RNA polymerase sigma factor [Lachnospiraceae bacterium]
MKKEELESYFRKYHSMLFRIAFAEVKSHADAEDIMQEVFIRLLRYQPEFASAEHEKAWMIRATLNLCKDFLKSKWSQVTTGLEQVPESEKVYMKVPYLEQDEILWHVLSLQENYRRALYLFYYEDYAVKEIADILEMPVNTVKTNLKRGREELRKLLLRETQDV